MITNFLYGEHYIGFENSNKTRINLNFSRIQGKYYNVKQFLLVKNGLILIMELNLKFTEKWEPYYPDGWEPTNNEERRRNILKIDENGKIVWQVEDPYEKYWKNETIARKLLIPPHTEGALNAVMKDAETESFNMIYIEKEKIIVRAGINTEYFLNPDTGELEFYQLDQER